MKESIEIINSKRKELALKLANQGFVVIPLHEPSVNQSQRCKKLFSISLLTDFKANFRCPESIIGMQFQQLFTQKDTNGRYRKQV